MTRNLVPALLTFSLCLAAQHAHAQVDARLVYQRASPSVVVVEAITATGKKQGSGVAIQRLAGRLMPEASPLVATNAHVLEGANAVYVLKGGRRFSAEVDTLAQDYDLALLIVEGLTAPEAPRRTGRGPTIGEAVFAIGAPLGLENTISPGIISGRRAVGDTSFIQTTAPISPGSSGGGLFDATGALVGITTFKIADGESLNFAIDAEQVYDVLLAETAAEVCQMLYDELIKNGSQADKEALASPRFVTWLQRTKGKTGKAVGYELGTLIQETMTSPDLQAHNAQGEQLRNRNRKSIQETILAYLAVDQRTRAPKSATQPPLTAQSVRWVPVGIATDGSKLFLDTENVSTKGAYSKAWVRWEFPKDRVVTAAPHKRYRSTKELYYFNCEERTSAIVQALFYSDPLPNGTAVHFQSVEAAQAKFSDVIPGGFDEMVLGFICRTRK